MTWIEFKGDKINKAHILILNQIEDPIQSHYLLEFQTITLPLTTLVTS